MRSKILAIMTVVASVTNYSQGSPHHHDDDPYRQAHRLLKEARKAQKYRGYGREFYENQGSSQVSQFQERPGSNFGGNNGGSGGGGGGGGSPPNPILTPGSSGGNGGNFGTIGSAISGVIPQGGGNSPNYPPILPNFPGGQIPGNIGALPPYPIEQVNRGVSTILNGVRSFDLGQILRGAFVFPRNENVRSVANNVLDSIFGAAKSQPTGGNSRI